MTPSRRAHWLLVWFCVVVVGVMVWSLSRLALLYVLTDGVLACGIVLAPALFGLWLVPWFVTESSTPLRWQFLIGAGLGVGLLSLGVLTLGAMGLLSKPLWVGILLAMGIVGLIRLMILLIRRQRSPGSMTPATSERQAHSQHIVGKFRPIHIALLALMPFAALALLVATVPPGVLWAEEARGYDVLEYHLQVPKEYALQGQITYLPHNIYSNFPGNAEMLYLLAMIFKSDPYEAAILAKFLNTMLAGLFVMSAWLVGREYHPTCGVATALLAGSAPWLMYLCGVAYVENGMLFFGMLCAACICLYDRRRTWGLVLLAGLFAGLSCGFKYTAAAMIAAPLCVVVLVICVSKRSNRNEKEVGRSAPHPIDTQTRHPRSTLFDPLIFIVGVLVTFSPWLIKNVSMTGNPVFPLAYSVFGASEGVWTDDLAERWQQGHSVEVGDVPLRSRLTRFKERILLDGRLGWWLVLLTVPILFGRASSGLDRMWFAVFVAQAIVWLVWTHLLARFSVPMLIPLCILGGRVVVAGQARAYRAAALVAVLAVVAVNLFSAVGTYADELTSGGAPRQIHGRVDVFHADLDPQRTDSSPALFLRHRLPNAGRVLLVGEARAFYMPDNVDYCVVFNRNPFAEAVSGATSDDDIIRWLNKKGYTHLLVDWSEMERLRRTYGFWEQIDAELFQRLEARGLKVVKIFFGLPSSPYATLYEVRIMPTVEDIGEAE